MWNDAETTQDFVNLQVVAVTVAELIRGAGGQPLSVGISGGWGVGKSSLVKMTHSVLANDTDSDKKYLFVEFNAWLYQGFDDAKMALIHSVADEIFAYAQKHKTLTEKAIDFVKRVRIFRLTKLLAPAAIAGGTGIPVPGAIGGLIAAGVSVVSGEFDAQTLATGEDALGKLSPEFTEMLKAKADKSPPKEIQELRNALESLLSELGITLVVFVDDLDRCLPETAISTLEAIRLLLFLKHSAFIIAADEKMIRNAVRAHFRDVEIDDELVTSYFDKLIQVPIRVPRLGISEVKAYVALLFIEKAERDGVINSQRGASAHKHIQQALRDAWKGTRLDRGTLEAALELDAQKLAREIEVADQLAHILATTDQIGGNPRLIKRFLNTILLRQTIAKAQGMTVDVQVLAKMLLFERCAPSAALDYLASQVNRSHDGMADFLGELEDAAGSGKESLPTTYPGWDIPFVRDWLALAPKLAGTDLRPILHLSRDRSLMLSGVDELSTVGKGLLEGLLKASDVQRGLTSGVQKLGEQEADKLMTYAMAHARRLDSWTGKAGLVPCLTICAAFPPLGVRFAGLLDEVPVKKIGPALVPLLESESWASNVLAKWKLSADASPQLKKALQQGNK